MNDEIEIERSEEPVPPSQGKFHVFLAEKRNLFFIVAGVFIVALIFFFSGISGRDKSQEVLVQMEKKLAAMERKIATLETQQKDLASGPVRSLMQKVETLEKRPAEKATIPASAIGKTAPPAPTAKRYHNVKKGDTLAGIAKKYKLSVAELRRLNRLSPQTTLVAGRKLVVNPGRRD